MWWMWTAWASAAVFSPASQPDEVTVYASQARVTRQVEVRTAAGAHQVVFSDLPATLIEGSVVAEVSAPARSGGVDLVRVSASEAADARVAALVAQREQLSAERRGMLDDEEAARAELAWLATARKQSATALSSQLLVADDNPDTMEALQQALSAREVAAQERRREAERRRRGVEERIAALDRERATLGSSATDTYSATVRLRALGAGSVVVRLSYGVSGASWTPRYDIRGQAESGEVEVALSAQVSQSTGEEWADVSLAVSSARPDRGTDVPELDPFWLRRPTPAPTLRSATRSDKGMAMMMESEVAMSEDGDFGGAAPAPAPMEVAEAQVQTTLMATTFTVEGEETLSGDGSARRVRLTTAPMEAELRHVAVPRLAERVYLVGEVTNTAGFPLLAGQAGVFLDGDYLGKLELDTVAPGETLDVAFGVDDRVRVEREPASLSAGDEGLLGKRARSSWQWSLTLNNAHERPVEVEVREQIPLTTAKEVEVGLLPQQGGPVVVEEDEGMLSWTVALPAGSKSVFTWGYRVDHPAEMALGWME